MSTKKMKLSAAALVAALVTTLAGAAACSSDGEKKPDAPAEDAAPKDVTTMMSGHYDGVTATVEAIIAGSLEGAKAAVEPVATRENSPDTPPEWAVFLDSVKSKAAAIQGASDLLTAARQTTDMAGDCGLCHQAFRGGPFVLWPEDPPEAVDGKSHMQRHRWAMTRLIEGIVGPDEEAWTQGIEAFSDEPVDVTTLKTEGVVDNAEVTALAAQVHEAASPGKALTDPKEQATLAGDVLTTCVKCHNAVRPR